jgi:outer membrane murein-binding lipoprotein Lpp
MLFAFATLVDSRKGGVMVDRIDLLTERVQVVEGKVDRLSSTVGQLTTRVDGLTTTVNDQAKMDAGYTRVEAKMDVGFAHLDRKLDQLVDAYRPRLKPKRRNE